jgi:adenosylcobinamide kinase / adenosylcobinamide-phosphate guanylyltransferase
LITFLTGGARSGKSALATRMAMESGSPVRMIATARADDDEMSARIERHRVHRPETWVVVEAPVELVAAIETADESELLLIDCVTLWISNLMVEREDTTIEGMIEEAVAAVSKRAGKTIVVSNEVGSGIVPMSPLGRRFRDLQGRANQRFAATANTAFLVVAGRLLRLEGPPDVL